MDNWLRIVEISMGLELFLGAILIMVINRRFKIRRIGRRTFHIQNLEVLTLIILLIVTELASIKFSFLRNKFLLTIAEVAFVFIFLLLDRKLNGSESIIGDE